MTRPGDKYPRRGLPVPTATMKDTVTGKPVLEATDQKLVDGVLARQARALAKVITLVESTRADHQARAERVLEALLPAPRPRAAGRG